MDEIKTKQQVVEKIKEATKILVTVSDDPSVDALSAALALTLLLDKQQKYATAIFSGETPPAIAFLQPEKTFDDTTDSLRDFIIALNKEKADHLRYKVVDDAVKIFITPYKTTITQDDLEFSQGDYNVELVIALGVDKQANLDRALQNHGQILHDASIITMTAGDQTSDLGGIDWHDSNSSSLSEMVAGLAEALKVDKKKSLLDSPIATALLTGVVAETDRFSNEHTTSKALTVAATLMSAGADQQLIANELQAAATMPTTAPDDENDENQREDAESSEGGADDTHSNEANTNAEATIADDGALIIEKHESDATSDDEVNSDSDTVDGNDDNADTPREGETLADLDRRVRGEDKAEQKVSEEVQQAYAAQSQEPQSQEPQPQEVQSLQQEEVAEPVLGGVLNATAEQAAEDARRAAESDQNKTILSHSYLEGSDAPAPAYGAPNDDSVAPAEEVHSAYAFESERVIEPIAPAPTPDVAPATPNDFGLPMPPPLPDFSQVGAVPAPFGAPVSPLEPALPLPPTQQPAILGDILAPEPIPEPTPVAPSIENTVPSMPAPSNDPGQFQIPPQQ